MTVMPTPERRLITVASSSLQTSGTNYANNEAIGGLFTFAGAARRVGGGGWLDSVWVADKSGTLDTTVLRLWVFGTTPAGTYTDAAALALTDADATTNLVGAIALGGFTDHNSGTFCWSLTKSIELPYVCSGTSLFGVLEITTLGGLTAFAAASDLSVTLGLRIDD